MKNSNYKVILASKSPRRKELLKQIGFEFDILVSEEEETVFEGEPEKTVMELSFQKALNVSKLVDTTNNKYLIIGADTVVSLGEIIMGKPYDEHGAKIMLRNLSGKTHQVYNGVTLLLVDKNGTVNHKFVQCTNVTMYDITDEEIDNYISTGEPMDKAGSYGIQGMGAKFIKSIEGDYNNVVGLPIGKIYQQIKLMNPQ